MHIVDITDGDELRIIGQPADIDRVQHACKEWLRRLADNRRADLNLAITVVVPTRES